MNGTDEGKAVFEWFRFTVNDVFGVDYLPQAIKPIEEVKVNHNRFTGRKVVPEYLKRLEPREQWQPWTPEILKEIGDTFNVSPLILQHLIRGYSAALGMFVVDSADVLLRLIKDYPDKPAMTLDDYGIGMVKRSSPARTTKYVNEFYDLSQEIEKTVRTYRHYLKMDDPEAARKYMEKNKGKMDGYRAVTRAKKALTKLNKRMRLIQNDKTMDSKMKREKMDELTIKRNKLAMAVLRKFGI